MNEKTLQQKTVKTASLPKAFGFFTRKKMEMIKELDEIMREMIWLIRSERPAANKTLFGKVYRALQQAKGVKLTEKHKHSCDQYTIEKVSEYQYRIFEHCQKHRNPDMLAKIDWSQKRVNFQFQGQNYSDTLGLAASLVAPTIDCQVVVEDEAKLVEFHCAGFRITRAESVIRFESLNYKKGKDPMMFLKGEVLKNLLPYSDYTIRVPQQGKVQIVEKKKVPDNDEITAEQKEKERLKAQSQPNTPAPKIDQPMPPAPIDPRATMVTPLEPARPLREEENQNLPPGMMKNSPPDVIEIKEPPPSR